MTEKETRIRILKWLYEEAQKAKSLKSGGYDFSNNIREGKMEQLEVNLELLEEDGLIKRVADQPLYRITAKGYQKYEEIKEKEEKTFQRSHLKGKTISS